ncbi:glycosyltransferase family 2 protein [Glacieibacterium sp.]|uniref:glycosyltransferase family 2 protein n=1 Tax=Glacieibacterium sp. TaxID=2860237 RepID=UPI003B00900A
MTSPIVSIIMPAFNAGRFIEDAIASVREQTLADWELIVVDDASTDDTARLVADAAARDPRIRSIRLAVNRGPAAARNVGIDAATGEWLALLDADDRYDPARLRTLVHVATAAGADLCSDNLLLDFVPPKGAPQPMIPTGLLSGVRELRLGEFIQRTMADPAWPGVNFGFLKPILRRRFLLDHRLRYDERVRFAEDFSFYVDCLQAGGRWFLSPEPLYIYRVRGDSLTQVQTVADLDRLIDKLNLVEGNSRGDRALAASVRRQRNDVARRRDYRAFTDAIKSRQFADAAFVLGRTNRSLVGVIGEMFRQTPVILKKFSAGGYRR